MSIPDPRHTSIEQAQSQSNQTLYVFDDFVVRELDSECWLSIEVNGVPVTRIACMDSALVELAAGWSLMHRFCERPRDFRSSVVSGQRAAVMVNGGIDIDERLAVLRGYADERVMTPEPFPRDEAWSIPEDVLLDILREAWATFRSDHMSEGSIHAGLASEAGMEVIAFDVTAENAVTKLLGWSLCSAQLPSHEILIVNGVVTRRMLDAAARVGVQVIATPFVPTADAFRAARVAGVSIVGYMRQRTVGIFHDAGKITSSSET